MGGPLVTITIPTYNSAGTLGKCLEAVRNQSYKNVEINIVDKSSHDDSINIARRYGVKKILTIDGSLLEARYEGTKMAEGKFTLILDSDQILVKDALSRAVNIASEKRLDMLAFEENVYKNETFVEKLFKLDRGLINAVADLSPFTGVIMPRFFKTVLLKRAYDNIPRNIFSHTGGPDHAIVYYESWLISKRVGVLSNAIKHIEPRTLGQLIPKFYRWGYTSVDAHFGKYKSLMEQKERLRTGLFANGLIIESLGSVTLLVLKGIGFKLGYYRARIDRMLNRHRKY